MRITYKYIILVIIAAIIFSSCSTNIKDEPGGPVILTFATFMEEGLQADAYKDIINAFEEEHKNIKINLQSGAVGYDEKIKNALEKGNAPDIIGLQRNKLIEYASQGNLMDITEWVDSAGLKEKYYGVNLGYGKFSSKYYGIGDLPYTAEWFYNADTFKKAKINEPQDLEQLIDACNKLKNFTTTPIVFGAKDNWASNTFFGMISVQTINTTELSDAFISGDKQKFAALNGAKNTMDIFGRLVKSGAINKKINDYTYNQSIDEFIKGRAAILPMGSWAIEKIEALKPKGLNYKVFENPVKLTVSSNSPYSATAVQVISINSKTQHTSEVMEFMDYLFSEDAQKLFAEKNGISGLKSVNSDSGNPLKKQVLRHLEMTDENSAMYVDNISKKMMEVTGDKLTKVIDGTLKPENAWEQITNEYFIK